MRVSTGSYEYFTTFSRKVVNNLVTNAPGQKCGQRARLCLKDGNVRQFDAQKFEKARKSGEKAGEKGEGRAAFGYKNVCKITKKTRNAKFALDFHVKSLIKQK